MEMEEHQELFSELTAFTEKQKIFDDVDPSKIEQTIKNNQKGSTDRCCLCFILRFPEAGEHCRY